MDQNYSAATNLRRKTNKELIIGASVFGLSLLTVVVMILLSLQQIPKITILTQEVQAVQSTYDSQVDLESYLQSHTDELVLIDEFIPNKEMMVDFIQTIEQITKEYDPEAKVRFTSQIPQKAGVYNVIPLTITMKISLINFLDFLKQFEQLPYLLQVQTVDLTNTQNVNELGSATLGVQLYVQDPFN